ncbi:MAG TPA: hypothetical protein VFM38_00405 [Candidatus Limnocylindrales bacterium]|nr:hypothetical protein [Candidatus Limnocylindrales bacterium]
MLRNAVLHITNEQPLLADLFELPNPTDVALRLTNLRSLDGKRPIFVDDSKSVFLFPYHRVSFVEIPAVAMAGAQLAGADPAESLPVPVPAGVPVGAALDDPAEDDELEIDEDFLRRIREV